MANQYPPTHAQYVDSVSHQAANLGAAAGMIAGIAAIAMGVMPLPASYLTVFIAPLVLFAGAAVGMAAMSVAGSLYASVTYQKRFKNEFAQARELTQMMAEDPQLPPVPPRDLVPQPDMLQAPEPAPRRSWTSLFHRRDNTYAQQIIQERNAAQADPRAL